MSPIQLLQSVDQDSSRKRREVILLKNNMGNWTITARTTQKFQPELKLGKSQVKAAENFPDMDSRKIGPPGQQCSNVMSTYH